MAKALFLSPMVASTSLDESVTFLEGAFGFKLVFSSETYRICEKDGLTLHLQKAGKDVGECAVYLEVDDLDEAWDRAKSHLDGVRHRSPFEQEYRMREFHVDIPHTNCLFFVGQSI
ncbi:MAG TPA: hypothetical protein PKA27_06710 [Fimbriimonadaceae bacterium]|nr:hypothetical protein [Fimbriimonadaceae bacterium]